MAELSSPKLAAWLRLLRAPSVGPVTFRALFEKYGEIQNFLAAGTGEWRKAGLQPQAVDFLSNADEDTIAADLEWLAQDGCHLLLLDDPAYPPLLREIPDAPAILFARGDLEVLTTPQIAMVGSRNPSAEGKRSAREFAQAFATQGVTVTSGLAMGIDGEAHAGALDAGGFTLAVCATGLEQVYPARHRDLARRIAGQGLLVSEFPHGTQPRAELFPRRNRIISALAQAVVVVEAAERSGSLITARYAAEQGREVFAIPGSIRNPMARGCHRLIRDGVQLVESPAEVIETVGGALAEAGKAWQQNQSAVDGSTNEASEVQPSQEVDEQQQIVLSQLGSDPVSVDQLVQQSGLTANSVSAILTRLEIQGAVSSNAVGQFTRT